MRLIIVVLQKMEINLSDSSLIIGFGWFLIVIRALDLCFDEKLFEVTFPKSLIQSYL